MPHLAQERGGQARPAPGFAGGNNNWEPIMQRRRLPGTDLNVSALCYGTGGFGTALRDAELDLRIRAFRDAGGNFFDTAHCYAFWVAGGDGASERALGDYLRRNGRGDLVIGTKGGHISAPNYRQVENWLSPGRISADIDDSLARLGLDTLDFYWLHRDDTRLQPGEIIETLNAEIHRGRIRFLGASNWRAARIAAANDYATAHGLQGFAASQPEWNLARKNIPDAVRNDTTGTAALYLPDKDLEWHRQTGFPLVPYSSTACGYFGSGGVRAREAYDGALSQARLSHCRKLAAELNATPGQIALAWLLNQTFPVFPIIGTLTVEHLREAAGATAIRLTPQQVAWIAG